MMIRLNSVILTMAAMLAICLAGGATAQSSISSVPTISPNTTTSYTNGTGYTWDVVCGPLRPQTIKRVGVPAGVAGTYDVTVLSRIDGGWTVNPPTSSSHLQTSGWVNHGTATAVSMTPVGTIVQIPLDIDVTLQPSQRLGLTVIIQALTTPRYTSVNAAIPPVLSNGDIELHFQGGAGAYLPSSVAGHPQHSGISTARYLAATVWYELPVYPGQNCGIHDITLNNNTGPVLGNNSIEVVLRNSGTVAMDNVNVPVQYSTDNGSTWSAIQNFSFPSFPSGGLQTVVLAPNWNIPALGLNTLDVRIQPGIGTGLATATRVFRSDADITGAILDPALAQIAVPLSVKATVTNNGDFSLAGVPMPLRYTIDGNNWVSQTFTPTGLVTLSSTETFTFTTPVVFPAIGTYNLVIEFTQQVPGDPDAADSFTRNLPNFGDPNVNVQPPVISGTSTSSATGLSYAAGQYLTIWTPEQLGYIQGQLLKISFPEASAAAVSKTIADVKIYVGETTNVSGTHSTNFISNFNAGNPRTLCYDGPIELKASASGQFLIDDLLLTTPYIYSGVNNLVVHMVYTGGATTPSQTFRYYNNAANPNFRLYTSSATTTVGTYNAGYAHPAKFVFDVAFVGSHVKMDAIGITNNLPMAVGNNEIFARIKNVGTVDLSNTTINMEYSLDGGTTWIPHSITPTAFNTYDTATTVLTASWNVPAVSQRELKVRLASPTPIGLGNPELSKTWTPDLDITSVSTTPAVLFNSPTGVIFTVQNNGDWNLNGEVIPFRYTIDGGVNYITENFTLSTLPGSGSSQSFSFTQNFTIQIRGSHSLRVEANPSVGGDPDNSDAFDLLLSNLGVQTQDYGTTVAGTTFSVPIYGSTTSTINKTVYSIIYSAADLPGLTNGSEITSIGFYKHTAAGHTPSVVDGVLRVWLANTTNTTFAAASTYGVETSAPSILMAEHFGWRVPDGPNTIGWVEFGPFNQGNTFIHDGTNLKVVVEYSIGPNSAAPFSTDNLSWRVNTYSGTTKGLGYASSAPPTAASSMATTATGTMQTRHPSLQVGYIPPGPTDLDVIGVSFGTNPGPVPAVGSNVVNVTVRSMGTQPFTGTYSLRYSGDGGTTWSAPETFTAAGLTGILTTQDVTFTAPWIISASGSHNLRVEFAPQVTGDPDLIDRFSALYRPDLDVDSVAFAVEPQLNTPVAVTATIKNNGTLIMPSNYQIPLRYRVSNGPWTNETFVATTLSAIGSSETFTFTQLASIAIIGDAILEVEINPNASGDPDLVDSTSKTYFAIGVPKFSFRNVPPAAVTSSGSTGVGASFGGSFEIQAGPNPITIHFVHWYGSTTAGTYEAHVSIRRGGAFVNYPPTVGTDLILSGWDYIGSGVYQDSGLAELKLVPVHLGVTLAPNEIIGISVVQNWHTIRMGSNTAIQLPAIHVGPDLSIRYAGVFGIGNTNPGGPRHASSFGGLVHRDFGTDIIYSLAAYQGTHVSVDSVQVNNGGGLIAGSNTVEVVIKNSGSLPLDNTPITAEYSTDGGNTWVGSQTFSFPSFPSLNNQTGIFTLPWTGVTVGPQQLQIRLIAPTPIGQGVAQRTRDFVPDADVGQISLSVAPVVLHAPMNVQATVENNGGFNLNGQPLSMRYRITQVGQPSGNWNTQVFTPATLNGTGDSETFAFHLTPETFNQVGNYTIEVEITPQVTGDPDPTDTNSRTYADLGLLVANFFPPGTATTSAYPFSSNWLLQTSWAPSQLNNLSGNLMEMGLAFNSNITATWSNVKITVGESTSATLGADFMANFNAGNPPIVVYDAPLTLTNTPIGTPWRIPLQNFYNYSGNNALVVLWEVASLPSPAVTFTHTLATDVNLPNSRVYAQALTSTVGTVVQTGLAYCASFVFEPVYNPGLVLTRPGARVRHMETDNVGVANTANHNNTFTYQMENNSSTNALTVSSVTVLNPVNCTATLNAPHPTSVAAGTSEPLSFTVNPLPGPYSFQISIASNTAQPGAQPMLVTVEGTGFVNTAPDVSVSVPTGSNLQVSGTSPNLQVEGVLGDNLASSILGIDIDGHQNLNVIVTEISGGTITAAAAGFTTIFPAAGGPGSPPVAVAMDGTAIASGTVVFSVQVADNGVFSLNNTVTVTYRIGARLDVTSMDAHSQFVRVNGRKDFYRGQQGRPINMLMDNPNPFPIELTATSFLPVIKGTQTVLNGFTFNLQGSPVVLPANSTANPVVTTMDIAANADGTNGEIVELILDAGSAIDPVNPLGNPIVVKILDPVDEFDLYDGPIPQPMEITVAAILPMVETVPFLQDLTVSGGLGTYTWSIAPNSPDQLPQGMSLNPNGNQFLPASIQGTPALGESATSPRTVIIQVTDGAYIDTRTYTVTVSQLLPLVFAPVTMPQGQEWVSYPGVTLSASGGSQIYFFSVEFSSQDQLPPGLSLNAQTGEISGTPADQSARTYNITFEVSDGISTQTQSTSVTIISLPLQWRGTTLPGAETTVAYSQTLDAIGGIGARIYDIAPGSAAQLPNGLSLNSVSGLISGVPAVGTAGSRDITFRVTDGNSTAVTQVITLVISVPPPLTITTTELQPVMVGGTLSQTIAATGGSRAYTFSVGAGTLAVPNSLTINAAGELSASPVFGDEGRFPITVVVNDGYSTVSKLLYLPVLARGADGLKITEVDVGTGYLEFTNVGQEPVDVSGWNLVIWVDGTFPQALPFGYAPGASLALPSEVVTFNMTLGGGGTWPIFSTGTPWLATQSSDIAVALYDYPGNLVDFVRIGNVNPAALMDGSANPAELPSSALNSPSVTNGSANYSLGTNGWVGSALGSNAAYNAGLTPFSLEIANESPRTGVEGEDYRHPMFAIGGTPPYTWSLNAPGHSWLSIDPVTGELFGTIPASAAGASVITVTLTDANMTTAVINEGLAVAAPTASPTAGTITIGRGEGQSFEGTVISVPVNLTAATGVTDISGFSFEVILPTQTAAEVTVLRVLPGQALIAANRTVVSRALGGNRFYVGDMDGPGASNIGEGVIAHIEIIVPVGGGDALEGIFPVNIGQVDISRNAIGVFTSAGVNGEIEMSNFHPADVNRDGVINVVDVQRTVNIILTNPTPVYPGEGDANLNGVINVVDVQTIVNCILGGNCQ